MLAGLSGDMDWSDVTSLDQNVETFMALVPAQVAFGMLGLGGMAAGLRSCNKARREMRDDADDALLPIMDGIDLADNEHIERIIKDVARSGSMGMEDKSAILRYANNTLRGRELTGSRGRSRAEDAMGDAAYHRGYGMTDGGQMDAALTEVSVLGDELAGTFSSEELYQMQAMSPSSVSRWLSGQGRAEQIPAAMEYMEAAATVSGIRAGIEDRADAKAGEAERLVRENANLGTGMVEAVTLRDGRKGFVKSGELHSRSQGEYMANGERRAELASNSLVVRDAATGETRMVPDGDIVQVDSEEALDAAVAEARKVAYDGAIAEGGRLLRGDVDMGVGASFDVAFDDGSYGRVKVTADNGDGTVDVQMSDGSEVKGMAKEVLQVLARNYRLSKRRDERRASGSAYGMNGSAGAGSGNAPAGSDAGVRVGDTVEMDGRRGEVAEVRDDGAVVSWDDGRVTLESLEAAHGLSAQTGDVSSGEDSVSGGGMQVSGGVPTDKDGNVAYDLMDALDAVSDIYNNQGLTAEEADSFVEANMKQSQRDVKSIEGKAPRMGTNLARYKSAKEAWQGRLDEARRKAEFWNEVADVRRLMSQEPGEREAAEMMSMTEPQDLHEYAALFLMGQKLLRESYMKELGYGNAEARKMFGQFASKEKGGVSIERASELLSELGEYPYATPENQDDVRNAIIDVLSEVETRGDLFRYISRRRQAMAEELVRAEREHLDDEYMREYGMGVAEYEAYVERLEEEIRSMPPEAVDEINAIIADEIDAYYKSKENANGEENIDAVTVGGAAHDDAGGGTVLQGAWSADGGRTASAGGEVVSEGAGEVGAAQQAARQDSEGREGDIVGKPVGERLTRAEALAIIASMEERAKAAPELELTIENWDAEFGEDGRVDTPLGEVKMGENQFTKLMRQGRNGKLGMIRPTLENPDIIVEDSSEAKDGDATERASSYVYVKTFIKPDGSRYYYFTSVTVSKDGHEVVVSNQEKRRNVLTNLLLKGKLVWKHADDVSTASDVADGLYSSQGNMSDPATEGTDAPQTNNSVHKHTDKSPVAQTVGEKVAAAEAETATDPTEGQKEAGNYRKGHVRIGQFDITVENPKGSVRRGVDASGKAWEQTMQNTYGYIRGTEGVDGDHIDVFLTDDIDGWDGRRVYVVDQYNEDGTFDEHKVMLGFNDEAAAWDAYLSNYEKGWEEKRKLVMSSANLEDFGKWIGSSRRKTKPFAEYKGVKKDSRDAAGSVSTGASQGLAEEAHAAFAGMVSASSHDVEIVDGGVSETDDTLYAPIAVDGRRTHLSLYQTEPTHSSGEPVVGVSYWRDGMTYDEASELADAYNGYVGRVVCRDGSDELAVLFGDIDEAVRFEEWLSGGEAAGGRDAASEEAALRDALVERLRGAGIEVIEDAEAGQRVLDEANGRGERVRLQAMLEGLRKAADFIVAALSGRTKQRRTRIEIPERANRLAEEAIGHPIKSHSINANELVHIKKRHGENGTANDADSIPLRDKDIALMPYIMAAPTRVVKGSMAANGTESVRYEKDLGNGVVIVVEREGRFDVEDMENITMWAQKKPATDVTVAQRASHSTSETIVISEADAAKIRQDAEAAIAEDVKIREHRVYHGSGADFERFDHSHMGEGEGAQAYGWGTYVTEVEGIGRTYAVSASGNLFLSGFGDFYLKKLREAISEGRSFEKERNKLLEWHSELYKDSEKDPDAYSNFRHDYEMLSSLQQSDMPHSNLYTVEIPDDTGDNYLAWEKPIPDTIDREKLWNFMLGAVLSNGEHDETEREMLSGDIRDSIEDAKTGKGLYKAIELYIGDREASSLLHDMGFTGISYPADNLRGGRADGARNYVIFNEDDLQIVDHVRFFRTGTGEAYGFTVGGRVYIDPRVATAETPLHEYAHLWATALREGNAEEWRNVVELMRGTPVWEEVKKLYPELETDDEIADEVLATYSGRRGAERLRDEVRRIADGDGSVLDKAEAISALERLREALSRFWRAVAEMLGIHYVSAEEVADKVLADLLEGVNPSQVLAVRRSEVELNELMGGRGTRWSDEYMDWATATFTGEEPLEEMLRRTQEEIGRLRSSGRKRPASSKKRASRKKGSERDAAGSVSTTGVASEAAEADAREFPFTYSGQRYVAQVIRRDAGGVYVDDYLGRRGDLRRDVPEGAVLAVLSPNGVLLEGYAARDREGGVWKLWDRHGNRLPDQPDPGRGVAGTETSGVLPAPEDGRTARIEKLRRSEPLVVSGNDYQGKYELDPKSATRYVLDELRGEYVNRDTGETIRISRKGAEKVMKHDVENDAHLKSAAYIPQMIENSIFITEETNTKGKTGFDSYRYYVVGLRMGGVDYTAKLVIGKKNGESYYDHSLTEIEKNSLLESIDPINTGFADKEAAVSGIKDKRLLSILQTNSSKVVDENGEPLVVYHGSDYRPLNGNGILIPNNGAMGKAVYFSSAFPEAADYAREKLGDMSLSEDEVYDNGYITEVFVNVRDEEDIAPSSYGNGEIIVAVRESNRIKSATDNTGAFSAGNDDIRYSRAEEDDVLYRLEDTKDRIEALFNKAVSGDLKGKPISIGTLTKEGKDYLEKLSGITFKDRVDFVLNPSDLVHIYKRHFGSNEKDGRNIPLDIDDIRSIADIISHPDKVIFSIEEGAQERKMFSFLKEADRGSYNLLEIYSDRKGNLTAKSFYKSKEGVSQRAISLARTLHSTSETGGATLNTDAKIPQMFENPSLDDENLFRIGETKRIGRQGKKITFTRANPTVTLNALKKRLENEGVEYKVHKARTGSGYISFEREGIYYDLRSANHTRAYTSYNASDDTGGVELSFTREDGRIDGIDIDLSENEMGVNEIYSLMDEAARFNANDTGMFAVTERLVYPEEINGYEHIAAALGKKADDLIREREMALRAEYARYKDTALQGYERPNLLPFKAGNGAVVEDESVRKVYFNGKPAFKRYATEALSEYFRERNKAIRDFEAAHAMSYDEWLASAHPEIRQEEDNMRDGTGAVTDDEVSMENDPMSKLAGKSIRTRKQRQAFAERERRRMAGAVRRMAERLHLDNVEIVTDAGALTGRRARAKGFYSPRTGKVTIVIPNHASEADAVQTLLHEAVAHYGLRELFGEHFDTFLDNVLANADEAVHRRILELSRGHGWDRRTATEEYLASLAEATNFEAASRTGWWQKIKSLFLDMLHRIGFEDFSGVTLSDNELRYILWRSYENLREPGRYRSILGEAEDIARQAELKVGRYAEDGGAGAGVAAESGSDSKAERIRKLRESEPVEITGKEIEASDDLKQYKKNALEYGKSLRANYQNKDTGVTIQLGKTGVKEVLNHDYKNVEQLQSIAAIPQIIENSIYIDSQENADPEKNEDVSMYHYYVCGLKIGDSDYTVRAVIAEQPNGNRYYDHKLTQIEKGKLLDSLSGITTPGFNQETFPISEVKDTKLLSLLQTEEEEKVLYRMADSAEDYERALVRDKYEKRAGSLLFNSAESVFDNMQSLKEAMQMIVKAEGRGRHIEEIEGFENAYLGENRLSSVNEDEMRRVARELYKPLIDAVSRLAPDKAAREALMRYMKAKHGLERNVEMRGREKERLIAEKAGRAPHDPGVDASPRARAAYEKSLAEWEERVDGLSDELAAIDRRDFAGLTGLTGEVSVAGAEAAAARMVEDYERYHDVSEVWSRMRAATDFILDKSLDSSLLSRASYDRIKGMYSNYVPLRGFAETTVAERYNYLDQLQGGVGNVLKRAKGRTTEADDPLVELSLMLDSVVMQGNRNLLVKQRFLNFVMNHPSDLVSVSGLYIEHDEVTGRWRAVSPELEADMTAAEVSAAMTAFVARMDKLCEEQPERYRKVDERVDVPYIVPDQRTLRQHQVIVKRGGRDVVLTVNGNPRLAQALNGLLNPDHNIGGVADRVLQAGETLNRHLAAFYTSRNPDFVLSNFIRDAFYSNAMTWVKEGGAYSRRFMSNMGQFNPASIVRLIYRYEHGQLDMGNEVERLFKLFMQHGGETGWTIMRDIDKHRKAVERELRNSRHMTVRQGWDVAMGYYDLFNRGVENCARFAAFLTSMQSGRSIDRSIWDAKEVSVNFNKRGSGIKAWDEGAGWGSASNWVRAMSGMGRAGYVFWNASVQGLSNFARAAKRNPGRVVSLAAVSFGLGLLAPVVNEMLVAAFLLGAVVAWLGYGDDDEDDKNSYWNLPEYVRRSNLLFRAGDQWISIPLPVEYRAVYGLGELMTSTLSGKEHFTDGELAGKIAGQVSQLLLLDFLEGGGGFKALIPSSIKPFAEAYGYEKSWTGLPLYKDTPFNKEMPEWTKAYKSANKYLVDLSETLNEISGGDKYTKGAIDFNPSKLEYVLEGYFGGVANTINRLVKMGETVVGEREYEPQSFLILNRILKNGDERTEYKAVNNEYFRLKEEHDKLRTRLRNYEHDTVNGIFDYAEKIDFLYNSPEYRRYEIFEKYRPSIDALYDFLKEANANGDQEAVKDIEAQLNEAKKEMVKEMEETRK